MEIDPPHSWRGNILTLKSRCSLYLILYAYSKEQ